MERSKIAPIGESVFSLSDQFLHKGVPSVFVILQHLMCVGKAETLAFEDDRSLDLGHANILLGMVVSRRGRVAC